MGDSAIRISGIVAALLACLLVVHGQQGRGRSYGAIERGAYPLWEVEKGYEQDVFVFARLRYRSNSNSRRGRSWSNDYPDSDLNFSARLQELTSLHVDPNGVILDILDPQLDHYPFVFMSNVGNMDLNQQEIVKLRTYLLNGGFLMADDFWAPGAWAHCQKVMSRVLPGIEPRELMSDHAIFNLVFDLKGTPQVPSIFAWQQGHTFEYWHGDPEGDEDPHFWAYHDEQGRIVALFCHNNDIGDGWEREGANEDYFHLYSERVSFPLGINIVMYVLTH